MNAYTPLALAMPAAGSGFPASVFSTVLCCVLLWCRHVVLWGGPEVEKTLSIPPAKQKLMYKGLLKDDSLTLERVGIKNGAKVLLIGSR